MFKIIECHANAREQRSTKKPFCRCCCCRCRRQHCRHHNARAAQCVHICGEPLFWFVAHCTRTCGEWREFRSEEKREMCNVFFKLWLCGILHYTTHMCVSGLASNVKLPLTCSHSGSRSLACSLICLCLPSSSFTLSSTTTSSSYLSVLSHTHTHSYALRESTWPILQWVNGEESAVKARVEQQ